MDGALHVMDIIQAASLIRMLPGNNLQKGRSNCLLTSNPGAHYRLSYILFAPFMLGGSGSWLGFLGNSMRATQSLMLKKEMDSPNPHALGTHFSFYSLTWPD